MIRLVLVGTGNVSKAIAKAVLETKNIRLVHVIGRRKELSADFPTKVSYDTKLDDLPGCDLVLLTVQDHMIESVSSQLVSNKAVVAHTSGASDINLLSDHKNIGVMYPLQSFSEKSCLDWEKIPICWEARTPKARNTIREFAQSIGAKKIVSLDLNQRTLLHLGAVLVNNFSNSLYEQTYQLFKKHPLDFDLLKPLIQETSLKINEQTPEESQTGPARRGDRATIEKHLSLIEDTELHQLYKTFTNIILTKYNHEKL
jgi:predicted short-subunit dehydrogenase-like oxidoreductase (DUF2520 family)